jgi:uncharacterized membrane protein YphA (DoxX/SURF4 family)
MIEAQANPTPSKAVNITLWVFQVLVAGMFIMASYAKLSGQAQMVQEFQVIGLGQWFRYVTGAIELGSAVLLFTPAYVGVGALLLACTMIGAVIAHVAVLGGNPAPAIVLLVLSGVIAWGRKERTFALLKN